MERQLPHLYYTSPRGQCAVMLLVTLRELAGCVTKREAIAYISENHWFALHPEDYQPYPSQRFTTKEPRWHTLIAWARKDSVLRDFVSNEGRDCWALTSDGRRVTDKARQRCESGEWPMVKCFLWSPAFKRFLNPNYQPTEADAQRPRTFYQDHAPSIWDELMA